MSLKQIEILLLSTDAQLEAQIHSMSPKDIRDMLTLAIKEQDRDTRHACAETVIEMSPIQEKSLDIFDTFNDAINKNDAHSEIMNCREGIKIRLYPQTIAN